MGLLSGARKLPTEANDEIGTVSRGRFPFRSTVGAAVAHSASEVMIERGVGWLPGTESRRARTTGSTATGSIGSGLVPRTTRPHHQEQNDLKNCAADEQQCPDKESDDGG
jgi:hypothetical protein